MRGIGNGRHYYRLFPCIRPPVFRLFFFTCEKSSRRPWTKSKMNKSQDLVASSGPTFVHTRTPKIKRIKTTTKSWTTRKRENTATSMEARNGSMIPLYKFNAQIGFRWSGITRLLPCPTSMLFFLRLVLSSAAHESRQVFFSPSIVDYWTQFYAPTQHGEKASFARGITTKV